MYVVYYILPYNIGSWAMSEIDHFTALCRSAGCEFCWCPMVGGGLTWCQECGLVRYCGEVCRMKVTSDCVAPGG